MIKLLVKKLADERYINIKVYFNNIAVIDVTYWINNKFLEESITEEVDSQQLG